MHITSSRQSEEFLDFSMSNIDQGKRPPRRTWEFRFEVETEAVAEDCRTCDIGGSTGRSAGTAPMGSLAPTTHGPLERRRRQIEPCSKAANGHWPSRGIHTGRAAELREVTDETSVVSSIPSSVRRGLRPRPCRPGRTSNKRCRAFPRSR